MTAATRGGIGACDRCREAALELGADAGLSDRGLSAGGYVGVSGPATSTERRRKSSDLSTADAMLSLPSCSSADSSPDAPSCSKSSSPCRSENVDDRPLISESMTAVSAPLDQLARTHELSSIGEHRKDEDHEGNLRVAEPSMRRCMCRRTCLAAKTAANPRL